MAWTVEQIYEHLVLIGIFRNLKNTGVVLIEIAIQIVNSDSNIEVVHQSHDLNL